MAIEVDETFAPVISVPAAMDTPGFDEAVIAAASLTALTAAATTRRTNVQQSSAVTDLAPPPTRWDIESSSSRGLRPLRDGTLLALVPPSTPPPPSVETLLRQVPQPLRPLVRQALNKLDPTKLDSVMKWIAQHQDVVFREAKKASGYVVKIAGITLRFTWQAGKLVVAVIAGLSSLASFALATILGVLGNLLYQTPAGTPTLDDAARNREATAKQWNQTIGQNWDYYRTRLLNEREFTLGAGIRVRLDPNGRVVLKIDGHDYPTDWKITRTRQQPVRTPPTTQTAQPTPRDQLRQDFNSFKAKVETGQFKSPTNYAEARKTLQVLKKRNKPLVEITTIEFTTLEQILTHLHQTYVAQANQSANHNQAKSQLRAEIGEFGRRVAAGWFKGEATYTNGENIWKDLQARNQQLEAVTADQLTRIKDLLDRLRNEYINTSPRPSPKPRTIPPSENPVPTLVPSNVPTVQQQNPDSLPQRPSEENHPSEQPGQTPENKVPQPDGEPPRVPPLNNDDPHCLPLDNSDLLEELFQEGLEPTLPPLLNMDFSTLDGDAIDPGSLFIEPAQATTSPNQVVEQALTVPSLISLSDPNRADKLTLALLAQYGLRFSDQAWLINGDRTGGSISGLFKGYLWSDKRIVASEIDAAGRPVVRVNLPKQLLDELQWLSQRPQHVRQQLRAPTQPSYIAVDLPGETRDPTTIALSVVRFYFGKDVDMPRLEQLLGTQNVRNLIQQLNVGGTLDRAEPEFVGGIWRVHLPISHELDQQLKGLEQKVVREKLPSSPATQVLPISDSALYNRLKYGTPEQLRELARVMGPEQLAQRLVELVFPGIRHIKGGPPMSPLAKAAASMSPEELTTHIQSLMEKNDGSVEHLYVIGKALATIFDNDDPHRPLVQLSESANPYFSDEQAFISRMTQEWSKMGTAHTVGTTIFTAAASERLQARKLAEMLLIGLSNAVPDMDAWATEPYYRNIQDIIRDVLETAKAEGKDLYGATVIPLTGPDGKVTKVLVVAKNDRVASKDQIATIKASLNQTFLEWVSGAAAKVGIAYTVGGPFLFFPLTTQFSRDGANARKAAEGKVTEAQTRLSTVQTQIGNLPKDHPYRSTLQELDELLSKRAKAKKKLRAELDKQIEALVCSLNTLSATDLYEQLKKAHDALAAAQLEAKQRTFSGAFQHPDWLSAGFQYVWNTPNLMITGLTNFAWTRLSTQRQAQLASTIKNVYPDEAWEIFLVPLDKTQPVQRVRSDKGIAPLSADAWVDIVRLNTVLLSEAPVTSDLTSGVFVLNDPEQSKSLWQRFGIEPATTHEPDTVAPASRSGQTR